MEFFNVLLPVHIKYDFVTESDQRVLQKEWTECRLNIQPAENSNRGIQAFCYPPNYSELLPYFMTSIDYASIRLGPVSSRSKCHTYGLFWDSGSKQCRILLALQDKDTKKRYVKYLKNLLALFRSQHEFENKSMEREQVSDDKFFENTEEILESNDEPPMEVFRVSDASGTFQDVVLRPKSQRGRRLPRPLAVFSNLFKFQRSNNSEKSRPHSQYRERIEQIISVFKKKPSAKPDAPSFQHFQQPLNEERYSDVMLGSIANMQWYDLNHAEMNAIEGRVTEILNHLNGDTKMGEADLESMCNLDFLRRLTISSNILWSHNLSQSQLGMNTINLSEVNLIGANMHEDQIRSELFIEAKTLTTSMESLDSNGYTVMKPERSIVIDDIAKEMEFSCKRANRLSFTFDENVPETPFPPAPLQEVPCTRIPSPTITGNSDGNSDTPPSESVEKTPSKSAFKRSFSSKMRPSKLFGLLVNNNSPSKSEKSATGSEDDSSTSSTTPEKKKYRKTPLKPNMANRLSFTDKNNRECEEQKNVKRSEEIFEKVFVHNIIESQETKNMINFHSNQQFTPTKSHSINSFTDASNGCLPASGKFDRNPSIVRRIKQVFTVKKTMYI